MGAALASTGRSISSHSMHCMHVMLSFVCGDGRHLFIYLSIYLLLNVVSIYLSIYLSVCLSVYFIYLWMHGCMCVCVCVWLCRLLSGDSGRGLKQPPPWGCFNYVLYVLYIHTYIHIYVHILCSRHSPLARHGLQILRSAAATVQQQQPLCGRQRALARVCIDGAGAGLDTQHSKSSPVQSSPVRSSEPFASAWAGAATAVNVMEAVMTKLNCPACTSRNRSTPSSSPRPTMPLASPTACPPPTRALPTTQQHTRPCR